MEIRALTAVELSEQIKKGNVTVRQAVDAVFEQIERTEESYHCYVTLEKEKALAQADFIQEKINSGELTGPLAGVPIAVKDNICTKGTLTTCSSKTLENFVPTFDAQAGDGKGGKQIF